MDGENSGVASDVTEFAVGGAWANFAAVTTEELDILTGFGFHESFSLLSELLVSLKAKEV